LYVKKEAPRKNSQTSLFVSNRYKFGNFQRISGQQQNIAFSAFILPLNPCNKHTIVLTIERTGEREAIRQQQHNITQQLREL